MANERDQKYTLTAGETIFIEGKHGIIQINAYRDKTTVIASEKTDARRSPVPSFGGVTR